MTQIAQVENVDRLAAVIIFLTSLLGVLINTFIALYIRKISVLKNSFGRLLQLQAVGDAIFEAVWCFYFAPTLFLNITPLQDLTLAARFAQLCLICYDISIYTHLIISFNRFICLYFPTKYARVFTDRFTNCLVAGIVTISFGFSFFLVFVKCEMGFSAPMWMLDYVVPRCDMTYVYYAEFVRGLVVISLFAVINTLTFIRMNYINRKKKDAHKNETAQQLKRRVMEKAFVQQVTIQGFIYVAELVTYFGIAPQYFPVERELVVGSANRWPNFILTTYAWILVHTLDGVVTLCFNRQFRQAVAHPFRFRTKQTRSSGATPPRDTAITIRGGYEPVRSA